MKRSRGRGRRGPPNHSHGGHGGHNRPFDSAGPDIKIRGSAANIYEKYLQLARDAGLASDRVAQENFLQHAEHYYRIMMANTPQQPQQGGGQGGQGQYGGQQNNQPQGQQQGSSQGNYQQPQQDGGQQGGYNQGQSYQQQPYPQQQQQPVPGPSFSLNDEEGDEAEEPETDEAAAS